MITIILIIFVLVQISHGVLIFKCCDLDNHYVKCIKVQTARYEDTPHSDNNVENELFILNATCITGNSEIVNASVQLDNSTRCMHLSTSDEASVIRECQRDGSITMDHQECDSYLKQIKFWGATMVIFANFIYVMPYILITMLYLAFAKLRKRAYNLFVLSFNATQVVGNVWMIITGRRYLCHEEISPTYQMTFGFIEMFTTVSSMLWVTVMCLDITLSITRFRWKSAVDKSSNKELKKFLKYGAFVWGFTCCFVMIALIIEVTPQVPKALKPQFYGTLFKGRNYNTLIYVLGVPMLTTVVNNVLFVYTSIKMARVKKETKVINENRKKEQKDLYFVFVKMYMLMDAPWITGGLAAIFPNLWLLKFLRMSQPMLMLIAILPREMMPDRLFCKKKKKLERAGTNNVHRQLV